MISITAQELASRLCFHEAVRQQIFAVEFTPAQESAWYELFLHKPEAFVAGLRKQPMPELLVLALYLRWAVNTYRNYQELGIPESVFFDTFRDLRIWSDECVRIYNRPGLTEWDWNAHLLRMEVIRLGRLEYQPCILAHDILYGDISVSAGTQILEVHIPAGESLCQKIVLESFAAAVSFFDRYYHVHYEWFHCHSWLLSPAFRKLLPPQSGILQFQNLFTVYDEDFSFPQAEQRVFGCIKDNPEKYPENTHLQCTLKNYLLSKKRPGMGYGVYHALK